MVRGRIAVCPVSGNPPPGMLGGEHWFAHKRVLWLEALGEGEPTMSGRLILVPEVVELLTVGAVSKPRFCVYRKPSPAVPLKYPQCEVRLEPVLPVDLETQQVYIEFLRF